MVIAKPEWFKRKKGGYWNFDMPWQGKAYMVILFLFLMTLVLMLPENSLISIMLLTLYIFLFMDMIIATWKTLDEKERMHCAIADRNGAWSTIIILIMGMTIQPIYNIENFYLYLIITAIISGSVVISITKYKLEKES